MKTMNRVLFTAAVAAVLGLGSTLANANDGIAASPKVRAQMNDRAASVSGVVDKDIRVSALSSAASPRVAQQIADRAASTKGSTALATVASTTAAAKDGIAASPKVRQQLGERGETIEIAPVK